MGDASSSAMSVTGSSGPLALLRRKRVVLVCLIALVPFAWLTVRFNWVCDDAYISFRYAKHLAEGHGLRYNVGENPPVEGYSNFLWVLLLAPIEAIGWPAPVWSCVFSVACGIVLVWRLTGFLARVLDLPLGPLMASALFFATLPPVAVWSTSGLVTMPQALTIFLAFEFLLADPKRPRGLAGGVACAVLILLRADGFVWVVGLIALARLHAVIQRNRAAAGPLVTASILAAVTLAGLVGFRLAYFGWPLPNTYYAKIGLCAMTLERGGKYLLCFLLTLPHLLPIIVAGIVVAWRHRSSQPVVGYAALTALGTFGYAAIVGGDFMAMWRLMVPALPFVAVLFGALMGRASARPLVVAGCTLAGLVVSLLPAYNLHVVPLAVREKAHFRLTESSTLSEYEVWARMCQHTRDWGRLARALSEHTKPGESIIRDTIGVVGYHTRLFIYDLCGLVNAEVAHRGAPRRRETAGHDIGVPFTYFLKDRPTYYTAVICNASGKRPSWRSPGGYYVLRYERVPKFLRKTAFRLRDQYRPVMFPLDYTGEDGREKLLLALMRKDLISPHWNVPGPP